MGRKVLFYAAALFTASCDRYSYQIAPNKFMCKSLKLSRSSIRTRGYLLALPGDLCFQDSNICIYPCTLLVSRDDRIALEVYAGIRSY